MNSTLSKTAKVIAFTGLLSLILLAGRAMITGLKPTDTMDPHGVTQVAEIRVEGMTCESCNQAVNTILAQVEGVVEVTADYKTSKARVRYDTTLTSVHKLVDHLNAKSDYEAGLP